MPQVHRKRGFSSSVTGAKGRCDGAKNANSAKSAMGRSGRFFPGATKRRVVQGQACSTREPETGFSRRSIFDVAVPVHTAIRAYLMSLPTIVALSIPKISKNQGINEAGAGVAASAHIIGAEPCASVCSAAVFLRQ
jgi:hypothetical protein